MKAVKCLVILMALAYCVEGRERLGKIFKRQATHREDKAIQSPQTGLISQSIVRNSFTQPQSQLSARPGQASEINVPLIPHYQQGPQQVAQTPFSAPLISQNQYQPLPSPVAQPSYAAPTIAQNQYQPLPSPVAQPSYAAQTISQNQYQPHTAQSVNPPPQVQQVEQISLQQALESPTYNKMVQRAYQTSPNMAQPIAMRDYANKILLRLPSNATLIRPYIVDGFSCLGRQYGYYADVQNECQIFHVCFPLKSVFNNHPDVPDVTYEFSFICNEFTRFSQDSLTCAWSYEAVPCGESELLYSINDHFFKITTPSPTPFNYVSPGGPIAGSVPLTGGYPGGVVG